MEKYMYLGLDLGTSGVKALLMDGDQKIIGSANGSLDVSRRITAGPSRTPLTGSPRRKPPLPA